MAAVAFPLLLPATEGCAAFFSNRPCPVKVAWPGLTGLVPPWVNTRLALYLDARCSMTTMRTIVFSVPLAHVFAKDVGSTDHASPDPEMQHDSGAIQNIHISYPLYRLISLIGHHATRQICVMRSTN
jgi:hypothetical protein